MKGTLTVVFFALLIFQVKGQNTLKGRIDFWTFSKDSFRHLQPNTQSNLITKKYDTFDELKQFLQSLPDTFDMVSIQDESLKKLSHYFFRFKNIKGVDIYAPKMGSIDERFYKMDSLSSIYWHSDSIISIPISLAKSKKLMMIEIHAKRIGKLVKEEAKTITRNTKSPYLVISINDIFQVDSEKGILYDE